MKIRTQLVVLVIAALLPVALFGAVMTARFWHLQREAYEQGFLERVRALRLAVDTEVYATVRMLEGLASPDALDESRRAAFGERAERMMQVETNWAMLGAVSAGGEALLHVRNPAFATDAAPDAATVAAVVAGRKPVVSGLLAAPGGSDFYTFIAVPVVRDGAVAAVLYAGIEHRAWLAFLQRYPITERGTFTLNDRSGTIVTRTLSDEKWVGKPASAMFLARARQAPEGAFQSTGLEGQAFYTAYSTSTLSGWTLGTGVPAPEVERAALGSTVLTLAGLAAAGLLALLLAFVFGRRIATAVTSLAGSARSLVEPDRDDRPRDAAPIGIAEIESVRLALVESGDLLRERRASVNAALEREAQARADAEHANHAKDQFLAMLGHELRNPLSAISNASTLLERTAPTSEAAARGRAMIQRQTQHLTQIVNDLLDVARITSGKVVLARRVVDLAVIVVHSVEALKDAGRFAGLALDMRVEHAPVLGDETRLEQVATNLVENACKYTPAGGRIVVRVGMEAGQVVLEVSDTGTGIAASLLPHVFELFVQGERTLDRAQGGLGLGLPVVQRLVELHGGTVTASSAGVGQGARFEVRLPAAASSHAAVDDAAADAGGVEGARLVLVEDHADTRESLRILLEQDGHDVTVAHDGPSGFERIARERPEVALVDIGMPGYDGMEVARRVRSADPARTTVLIALTGYGGSADQDTALEAGFDGYMVKPFDIRAFRATLAEHRPRKPRRAHGS